MQQANAAAGHVVIPPQFPSDNDKNKTYSVHVGNYSFETKTTAGQVVILEFLP
jgi:hypothetical protein